ncbi:unnamed protein product [Urochloa humidicola]
MGARDRAPARAMELGDKESRMEDFAAVDDLRSLLADAALRGRLYFRLDGEHRRLDLRFEPGRTATG